MKRNFKGQMANFKWSVLFALCYLPFALSFSLSQGILPPKKPVEPPKPVSEYVLIGNSVPETLNVINEKGKPRPLLSYKAANDLLLVGFYSVRCPQNQELWSSLKRLFEDYKGWHTAFVGVSAQPDETLDELVQAMTKAGLPYPAVRDDQRQVVRALHASATPQFMIIDEYGYLRYRGDFKHLRKALDALIGHEPMKVEPEAVTVEGCPIP